MQHIYIIAGAGAGMVLMILLISAGVVKKCRGRSGDASASDMRSMIAERPQQLPEHDKTKRIDTYDDAHWSAVYANVCRSKENDWDDAIYANM